MKKELTDQEVLDKAIFKAFGKEPTFFAPYPMFKDLMYVNPKCELKSYEAVIFSHDFAKAFWGEEKTYTIAHSNITNPIWKLCLSEMVLEENPIDYLRKFVES